MNRLIVAVIALIAVIAALVSVFMMENKNVVNLYTTPLIFPEE
jgi:hypothetical protein